MEFERKKKARHEEFRRGRGFRTAKLENIGTIEQWLLQRWEKKEGPGWCWQKMAD